MIAECDGSDTLLRKFIHGPGIDEPICMITYDAQRNEAGRYFYHFDALGSVIALSQFDTTQAAVVEAYVYDAFGACTVVTGAGTDGDWLTPGDGTTDTQSQFDNPYLFTARRWDDESGLYYYRARMYSPDLGRFLQPDPAGYIDTMNLYQYCGNNPLNWVDPMGTFITGSMITLSVGPYAELQDIYNRAKYYTDNIEPGGFYFDKNQCGDRADRLMEYLKEKQYMFWAFDQKGGMMFDELVELYCLS